MTKILIRDPANPARDGYHSITDTAGSQTDSLNGNIKMIFLTDVPQSVPTNAQRQPDNWSCGAFALAECLNQGGETVRSWLLTKGLITSAYGTDHGGIVKYLASCGYGCSWDATYYNDQMNPAAYQSLIKHLQGGKKAILLMGGLNSNAGGKCRNSYWSSAGHYVCAYGTDSGSQAAPVTSESTDYRFTLPQIKGGSQGKYVSLLQRLLKGRGLYQGSVDGSYGDATIEAVTRFQHVLNLTEDGICGPATWAAIIPCTVAISGSKATFTAKEITIGYHGNEAYFLQNLLRGHGYNVTLDFDYGDKCKAAVVDFKSKHGMDPADLACGKNTFKLLMGI